MYYETDIKDNDCIFNIIMILRPRATLLATIAPITL